MEIINLRHLKWFQLASDVSNQRAQYYANIQKFSRNYVERCLRKCIFCPNGQIVEVCSGRGGEVEELLDIEVFPAEGQNFKWSGI